MGFHEDERIRNKNKEYNNVTSRDTDTLVLLELQGDVTESRLIEVLTGAGLKIKLAPDKKIIVKT